MNRPVDPDGLDAPRAPEEKTPDASARPLPGHPESAHEAPRLAPAIDAPSSDVELAAEASVLPGVHRGGFSRLPTEPIGVTLESAPDLAPDVRWVMPEPAPSRGLSAWALGFAIVGLVVSLFVGWGFAIGIAAIVSAILALRRPLESRAVAIWAIAIAAVSIVYSALWLVWAASRANLFG